MLNQSNVIFFALFLAFVIYITMRGELPTYMGFFMPKTTAPSSNPLSMNNPANQATGAAMVAAGGNGSLFSPGNNPLGALWAGFKSPGAITGIPFLP